MQYIKNVVISAAGMGNRLGLNRTKCLVDVNGKKIIDYQLEALQEIPHVYMIIGFQENDVISYVTKIRRDVVFVRNQNYKNTTNTYSINLIAKHLKQPYLTIDGDLLFTKKDFHSFIATPFINTTIGIDKAKTEECVFVHLNEKKEVVRFSRTDFTPYEWTGVAYIKNVTFDLNKNYLFQQFEDKLPLPSRILPCFEVDTPNDLDLALTKFH